MDNDDRMIGQLLTRRKALALFGAAGAAFLLGCREAVSTTSQATSSATQALNSAAVATATGNVAVPGCVVKPEMTVGPYFLDEQLNRSDIRSEPSAGAIKGGVPLVLTFNVMRVDGNSCTPIAGAQVDIWHCDALGVYSGFTDAAQGFSTVGQKFLRGYQMTNDTGDARFTTIYPGWYTGRTVHIHFKIRTTAPSNQSYEFTSQLYFDEAVTNQVFARAPYSTKGRQDTTNAMDGIYRNGGDQLLLTPYSDANGYTAAFNIGLDLSNTQTGQADRMGSGGGPPGGGGPRPTSTP